MQKKLKRTKAYIQDNWKLSVPVLIAVGLIGLLLTYKLGSLVGGLSQAEYYDQQLIANDRIGLGSIVREPLFLPYTFLEYLLQLSPVNGPTAIRSIGGLFGALSVFGMFYIFRKWYTIRIAILGSILYATTSWFLHTARYADPASSYLLLPLLVAAMIALQAKARSRLAMGGAIIFGISALYIPGVILFLAPAIFIKRTVILKALRAQPLWFKAGIGSIGTAMLLPLFVMLIKPIPGSSTALQNAAMLFGLPKEGLHSLSTMLQTLKDRLSDIFFYANAGPVYVPGHLPWLDICTTVLVLLGTYQFAKHWRLDRSKLIAITGIFSLALIALGGLVSSVILLPFLFLFAVEGLKWLLDTWLRVFPRNPFARGFAVALVTVLVASVAIYHMNKYYLAWGRSPETRQVFNQIP